MRHIVEEADESEYRLLLLQDLGLGDPKELSCLLQEGVEILKVTSKIKNKLDE